MRQSLESLVLSREEQAALVARVDVKLASPVVACGRCDACNRELQGSSGSLCGYASGMPLGLCPKCASFVNTKEAVDSCLAAGYEPKATAITYNPQKDKAEVADDE